MGKFPRQGAETGGTHHALAFPIEAGSRAFEAPPASASIKRPRRAPGVLDEPNGSSCPPYRVSPSRRGCPPPHHVVHLGDRLGSSSPRNTVVGLAELQL